jgi:hypothetical protein
MNSAFIAILHISHNRVFNNEHKSYHKMGWNDPKSAIEWCSFLPRSGHFFISQIVGYQQENKVRIQ